MRRSTVRRWLLAASVAAGLLAAHVKPPTVAACSCMAPGSPQEELAQSDSVFSGTVVEIDGPGSGAETWSGADPFVTSEDPVNVTFEVEQVWKGRDSATLQVRTALDSAACGYSFVIGQSYIVYGWIVEDQISTGLCSRTAPLDMATTDLQELGPGRAAAAPTIEAAQGGSVPPGNSTRPSLPAFLMLVVGLGAIGLLAAQSTRKSRAD